MVSKQSQVRRHPVSNPVPARDDSQHDALIRYMIINIIGAVFAIHIDNRSVDKNLDKKSTAPSYWLYFVLVLFFH